MYCSNCGYNNINNEKYCSNCGCLLKQDNNISNNSEVKTETNNLNKDVNNMLNKNTKKYGIISIVVGILGILFAFIVGMSLWLSILISALGFDMARRSYNQFHTLSIIGYVLNGILLVIGILIYISLILGII